MFEVVRDKSALTIDNGTPEPAARVARPFPDEAACLEWLKNTLHPAGIACPNPACARHGEVTKHHRVLSRRSYCCARCGHHVHPTAGTVFHKSPTPLRLWFYAIYLMASTGCEVPARELQRRLRVTYKTAWRMSTQIRALLDERQAPEQEQTPRSGADGVEPANVAELGWAIARFVEGCVLDAVPFDISRHVRGRSRRGAARPTA